MPAKPHRVFTNDDISTHSTIQVPPGARRRLKQLNRCDRTCFNDVKKQAINFGYITVFPRSTREEMDDRLAADIEQLQNDPKWQQLLLDMISTHITSCAERQKKSQSPDDSPAHTPTRAEILAEEKRAQEGQQVPQSGYGAATSAAMAYRWRLNPDPLKASLMVYQWMDETKRDCPVTNSSSELEEDP